MFGIWRNQRWLTLTGSRYEITYISASIHDINEISTAVPMFSTSGNTIRLFRRMLDVRKGINQRWRQIEETSLITDRCLVQQEVLCGVHLKDV